MKEMILEIDANGDGKISEQEWLEYILDVQKDMKSENTYAHPNSNQPVKVNRRKSVLQEVMEDIEIDKSTCDNNDQVNKWMQMQNNNINIYDDETKLNEIQMKNVYKIANSHVDKGKFVDERDSQMVNY